ncbi:MAG TPA: rhodanese-like domain-containing protein [Geopsychrobacteraceae bacterium]|jgi:rhodanese-related sulfurtransferase
MVQRLIGTLIVLLLWGAAAQAAVAQDISAAQARDMLEKDTQVYLLDVRTFEEYSQVRLEGAALIPIDQLLRRIAEVPRDRPILVYCAVGSRSTQVGNYLAKSGYGPVYNLSGGIWAWQLRKFPVLEGGP